MLQNAFGSPKTNFPGCGRGHRMIVRGTTETRDELTGNFGSALEDASISDYRLIALFAEKTLNAIFGVLQHYPPESRHHSMQSGCLKRATSGLRLSDHLVSAQQECLWDRQAERLDGCQIDDKLELGRLLDRKVSWFSPFENFVDKVGRMSELIRVI